MSLSLIINVRTGASIFAIDVMESEWIDKTPPTERKKAVLSEGMRGVTRTLQAINHKLLSIDYINCNLGL